ncbi:MAG: hypothetical protein ACR2PK_12995 [Acidimicrobiales bacterium]
MEAAEVPSSLIMALLGKGRVYEEVDLGIAIDANAGAVAVASSNGVRFLESVARRDLAALYARQSTDPAVTGEIFGELIATYHAAGDRQNLRVTLGYVITLLNALGRHDAVLALHAALSQEDLPMSFTEAEEERLTAAVTAASESADAATQSRSLGRRMTMSDAVTYANSQLDDLLSDQN